MKIFLIGFMGSGKTTVSSVLAKKLNFTLFDIDKTIEKSYQKTINEIFEIHGENYFRQMEREILHKSFKTDDSIISTGGGCPCFFDNIQRMNDTGITVYLETSVEILYNRLKDDTIYRPLIKRIDINNLFSYISQLLSERENFYRQSKIVINTQKLTAEEIAKLIISEINLL